MDIGADILLASDEKIRKGTNALSSSSLTPSTFKRLSIFNNLHKSQKDMPDFPSAIVSVIS